MGENTRSLKDIVIDEVLSPLFLWCMCIALSLTFPVVWLWFRWDLNKSQKEWGKPLTIEQVFESFGMDDTELFEDHK